ncbi:MAG: hypothetical protein AB7V42_00975 [Thermoleophilia bacterium]
MRRGGPPALPLDPAAAPPFARVERSPRGLRFAPTAAPAGAADPAGEPLRVSAGAPVRLRRAVLVDEGRLVLGGFPGVAYTVSVPRMQVIHDRRPPGLDLVAGAPAANAGLLRGEAGWRVVVLPSLGDVIADAGPGPIAIRADGRRVAVAVEGAIEEWDLGADSAAARHDGVATALAYAADGSLLVAAGGAVGPPGTGAGAGSPVALLATAAAAPVTAALHEDGTVSVWRGTPSGAPAAAFASPVPGAGALGLSADGELVELGSPDGAEPVAALARSADGAQVRRIEGARAIATAPEGAGVVVAGDWGCAWLTPLEEDA